MLSSISQFLSEFSLPAEVYELIARAARYWFLLLMAVIVWRSYRWYRRDRRQAKKRLKLLPDAGFIGEMVVLEGDEALRRGRALPVPREGTLGTLRTNDLCVPVKGVSKRHLWFRFDEDEGLMVEPMRGCAAAVDGQPFKSRREPLYMAHGSRLRVGEAELRLRLFAGFEGASAAVRRDEGAPHPPAQDEAPAPDGTQAAAMQQQAYQQWAAQQYWMQQQLWQQQAYQQWLAQQAAAQQEPEDEPPQDAEPDAPAPVRDDSIFMRPAGEPAPQMPQEAPQEAPEPPAGDDDWPCAPAPHSDAAWEELADYGMELDEDLTDAAMPPKSAYVGHDEAEGAKRRLWDKYFGGGRAR